jgi:frataxin-like iron-binding protein CyaY
METTQIDSSAIQSVTYDEQTRVMTISFRNGHAYTYHMVPAATHRALLASPSAGAYFNRYIKKHFAEQKVR